MRIHRISIVISGLVPGLVPVLACTAACAAAPARPPVAAIAAPTGDVHDFDSFAGAWTTQQHRLKARGAGSRDWDDFPATLCNSPYLGGMITVDELYFPTKGWAGVTVRSFDLAKRQWSIYWINSRDGKMQSPVYGGFEGNVGLFFGEDVDEGRPVKVVYRWTRLGRDRATWEQAFSYDDGKTWETNWMSDHTRVK